MCSEEFFSLGDNTPLILETFLLTSVFLIWLATGSLLMCFLAVILADFYNVHIKYYP